MSVDTTMGMITSNDTAGDDTGLWRLTWHAACRLRERNLRATDLAYVLAHGARIRRTGVTFVVLRRRDIPIADRRHDPLARLEGTIVLLGDHGAVITVYRNRGALRTILKKRKGARRPAPRPTSALDLAGAGRVR